MALPGVIGLSVVQIMSAQSLFGIARKVAKDNRVIENSRDESGLDQWTLILLEFIYNEVYKGGSADLTLEPFVDFLRGMNFDLVYPEYVYRELFHDMDKEQTGKVSWVQFFGIHAQALRLAQHPAGIAARFIGLSVCGSRI